MPAIRHTCLAIGTIVDLTLQPFVLQIGRIQPLGLVHQLPFFAAALIVDEVAGKNLFDLLDGQIFDVVDGGEVGK